jgi:5-methylcytosine-specific restriction endonuclease McrA
MFAVVRWKQARAAARQRDGERCTNCGSTYRLQVHHKVPLSKGGERYALSNLTTLCDPCHRKAEGAGKDRERGGNPPDTSHPRNKLFERGPQRENEIDPPLVG